MWTDDGGSRRIDEWLRVTDPAKLAVRGIAKSRLVVTEIRFDQPNYGMTDPVIPQDAFRRIVAHCWRFDPDDHRGIEAIYVNTSADLRLRTT